MLVGIPPLATLPIPGCKLVITSTLAVLRTTLLGVVELGPNVPPALAAPQPGPPVPDTVVSVAAAGAVLNALASIRTPVRMSVPEEPGKPVAPAGGLN